MATHGKECKNPSEPLVAATLEKAKTYVLAETVIRDREVGGSNPLAPTSFLNPRFPEDPDSLKRWPSPCAGVLRDAKPTN